MSRLPLILDVDAGVDDTLAIAYALLNPAFDVLGITTVAGNVPVRTVTRNVALALRVLAPYVSSLPAIARGAAHPLRQRLFTAADVHGNDGIGGASRFYPTISPRLVPLPAHRFIARILASRRGVTLCATGPLTNVALLLKHHPEAFKSIGEIVIMGGGFDGEKNTGPVAEFNFYVDPVAADMVLGSGVPIRLVPLNATHRCVLKVSDLASLPQSPVRTFLQRVTRRYFAFHRKVSGFDGGYMHDALAVAAAGLSQLLTYRRGNVVVEPADSYARGMSLFLPPTRGEAGAELPPWMHRLRRRTPTVRVAFNADPSRFLSTYLGVIRQATR